MKRVLLSIFGTVVGLVALLDFKSHQRPIALAVGGTVPSPQPNTASRTPPTPTKGTGRSPASGTTSGASKSAAQGRFVGSAIETQYGVVQVAVTVSGGRITKVSFPKLTAFDPQSAEINSQAAPLLVQETMSAQSARIDTISGATYTSAGYVQSLQSALDRAGLK